MGEIDKLIYTTIHNENDVYFPNDTNSEGGR